MQNGRVSGQILWRSTQYALVRIAQQHGDQIGIGGLTITNRDIDRIGVHIRQTIGEIQFHRDIRVQRDKFINPVEQQITPQIGRRADVQLPSQLATGTSDLIQTLLQGGQRGLGFGKKDFALMS
ncbi:Uncharacterised protein [Vibrio cholerae]|uniref:Uncharacterized protein n=1 Tax=Vibrio cholerae TaxID=666 RepID=A0A655VLP9_VIBCL|nr:Uncharacterised protein [Vibrio cholerae]